MITANRNRQPATRPLGHSSSSARQRSRFEAKRHVLEFRLSTHSTRHDAPQRHIIVSFETGQHNNTRNISHSRPIAKAPHTAPPTLRRRPRCYTRAPSRTTAQESLQTSYFGLHFPLASCSAKERYRNSSSGIFISQSTRKQKMQINANQTHSRQ